MKTHRKKNLRHNKTGKISKASNKNKFIHKLKHNFFIDGHLHFMFKEVLLGKEDNKEYTDLPINYDHTKYQKLIAHTNWKPDGIVPCNIQSSDFFYKVEETALLLKKAKTYNAV